MLQIILNMSVGDNQSVRCSHCGSKNIGKRSSDFRYYCNACERRFTVTIGTMLENTNLSLIKWLFAFAVITDAKKGISTLQLQRNLGVSYPTAWSMYHKIRTFMPDGDTKLEGIIEGDETYIGGKPRKYRSAKFPNHTEFSHEYLDEKIDKIVDKEALDKMIYFQ